MRQKQRWRGENTFPRDSEEYLYIQYGAYLYEVEDTVLEVYDEETLNLIFNFADCGRVNAEEKETSFLRLLAYGNNQYDVGFKVHRLVGKRKQCPNCQTFYYNQHLNCSKICKYCKTPVNLHTKDDSTNECIYCEKCFRTFYSKQCFEFHSEKKVCATTIFCFCGMTIAREFASDHQCDLTRFCCQCKEKFNVCTQGPHSCFISPMKQCLLENRGGKKSRALSYRKMIFYDLECIVTDCEINVSSDRGRIQHIPNLICAVVFNVGGVQGEICQEVERVTLFGNECVAEFCNKFLVNPTDSYSNSIFIGHYSSKYDSIFVLHTAVTDLRVYPSVLVQDGCKIISMAFPGNKRFIDSYSFIPTALRNFSETFGLDKLTHEKGTFPFLFNHPDKYNYKGVLPDREYYGFSDMTESSKKKFLQWYNEKRKNNYVFDFKMELGAYCMQDCLILAQGVISFRRIIRDVCQVDPFEHNTSTLASLTMKVIRAKYLQSNVILNIPRNRARRTKYSKIAIAYLDFLNLARSAEDRILHAENSPQGEIRIGNVFVDGYCKKTKEVFEISGCFIHGHPKCYPNDRERPTPLPYAHRAVLSSLNTRWKKTMLKNEYLEKWGFTVHHITTCELPSSFLRGYWSSKSRKNSNQGQLLEPSDCLYGGRCEGIRRYLKATPEEEIHYEDITSLYPFICSKREFPVGEYIIIRPAAEGITVDPNMLKTFFGIIRCTILPPTTLLIPVLPIRRFGKTLFPLCNKCVELAEEQFKNNPASDTVFKPPVFEWNSNHSKPGCPYKNSPQTKQDLFVTLCEHTSVEERQLQGSWTTVEVQKALEHGYKLCSVDEIFHFPRRSTTVFSDYVSSLFRLKVLSSGWPKEVQENEEAKNDYLKTLQEKEGINLRKEDIQENPGLRKVSKLLLNAMWGKFATSKQRNTKYITDRESLMELFLDANLEIHVVHPISDKVALVQYSYKEATWDAEDEVDRSAVVKQYSSTPSYVNIILASFVTSFSRLYLLDHLNMLNPETIAYFDTDSCIYMCERIGGLRLPLGGGLGEFTSEIKSSEEIQEVVIIGPKSYGYSKVLKGVENNVTEVVKVRGFSLTSSNAEKRLNFKALKTLFFSSNSGGDSDDSSPKQIDVVYKNTFYKDNAYKTVSSGTSRKCFKIVYNKRIVLPGTSLTYPFGYKLKCPFCNTNDA